jgi:hypothetical protein
LGSEGRQGARAIEEKNAADQKARAQTAYDAVRAEIDQLDSTKPGTELQSLIRKPSTSELDMMFVLEGA